MKTPEHVYIPSCARCRDEAGKDRAKVPDDDLRAWHTTDVLTTLRAENERLRAAATEALAVLTRLADSAYQWAGRDVPPGLVSEIDAAKARLAGVLRG